MPLERHLSPVPIQSARGEAAAIAEVELRERRFRHVLRAILAALAIVLIDGACESDWYAVGLMLCAIPPALASGWLARRRRIEWAASLLVCTLTGLLACLAAIGQGLHDEAVLGIPGVFVLSGLFAKRRAFWITFVVFCAALVAIVTGDLQGWHTNPLRPLSGISLVNVLAILGVTAYYIDMMSNDLRSALARLAQENQDIRLSKARSDSAARHDQLTGLPNRLLARERLQRVIDSARRQEGAGAVLFVDLDNFKAINDTCGHAAGDAVLREVARRLSDCVRKRDTVGREGGDEFLLILSDLTDGEGACKVARKVLAELAVPFEFAGTRLQFSASIGIAQIGALEGDSATILRRADKAMYRAKAAGRNTFRVFETELDE